MANVFDQFDVAEPSVAKPSNNVFDQFDEGQAGGVAAPPAGPPQPLGPPVPVDSSFFSTDAGIKAAMKYKPVLGPMQPPDEVQKNKAAALAAVLTKGLPGEIGTEAITKGATTSPLQLIGASPEGVQTAADFYKSKLPPVIPIPGAGGVTPVPTEQISALPTAVAKTATGFADWAATPSGMAQLEAAGIPVARIPMAIKFFHDMAAGAGESAAGMVDAWQKGDTQGFADQLVSTIANTLGAGFVGYHGVKTAKEDITKGLQYAGAIRADKGERTGAGQIPEGSQADRRRNLQQAASGAQPEQVDEGARGDTGREEVAPPAQVPLADKYRLEHTGPGEFIIEAPNGDRRVFKGTMGEAKIEVDRLQQRGKAPAKVDTSKPHIVASAVQDPQTKTWFRGPNHPEVEEYLGMPKTEKEQRNTGGYGFVIKMPDGKLKVVGRKEATDIAKAAGQNIDDLSPEHQLHSDDVVSPFDENEALGDVKQPVGEVGKQMAAPQQVETAAADRVFASDYAPDYTLQGIDSGTIKTTEGAMGALVNELRMAKGAGRDPVAIINKWGDYLKGLDKRKQKLNEDVEQDPKLINEQMDIGFKVQFPREALDNIAKFGQREFPPEVVRAAQKALGYAVKEEAPPVAKLDPEHEKMLEIERGNVTAPVEVVADGDINSDNPFYRNLAGKIASVDREKGKILINKKNMDNWMKTLPQHQKQSAMRSVLAHEQIHLAVTHKEAEAYWKTLTGLEKAINKRRYWGSGKAPEMQDYLWGHEAIRFQIERAIKSTPVEFIDAVRSERITNRVLTALENVLRAVRKVIDRKRLAEGTAMIDKALENIRVGKIAENMAAGTNPTAWNQAAQQSSNQQADRLEAQARMLAESGDAETSRELMAEAYRLRGQAVKEETGMEPGAISREEREFQLLRENWLPTIKPWRKQMLDDEVIKHGREQAYRNIETNFGDQGPNAIERAKRYYDLAHKLYGRQEEPGARKKKIPESIWQEKFVLPGMESQKIPTHFDLENRKMMPGGTATPPGAEPAPPVPPEQRASAEAAGALPRLTGRQLQAKGVLWLRKAGADVLKAFNEGKKSSLPTFAKFSEFMQGQMPGITKNQLGEMWSDNVNRMLENATGEQLSALFRAAQTGKRLEGALQYSETARGRSSLLRGIVQGTQTIMDKPETGKVPTELGFEAGKAGEKLTPEMWKWLNEDPDRLRVYQESKPAYKVGKKSATSTQPRMPEKELPSQKQTPTELGFGTSGGRVSVTPEEGQWLDRERERIAMGQVDTEELKAINEKNRRDALERKDLIQKEADGKLTKEEFDRLGQIRRNDALLKDKPALRETIESNRLFQDKKMVTGMLRKRNRVIAALSKRMLDPIKPLDIATKKHINPEDLRLGGGTLISAFQDFDESAEHNLELLGWELVDESRRSKHDPVTASKRVTTILDRKNGEVWQVGTYRHPTRGTMLLDPLSPQNNHVPLEDILKRYRVIHSDLLDEPVQNFKDRFKNNEEYNEVYHEPGRARFQAETSYDPRNVPIDEFIEATGGGRVIETAESEGGGAEGTFPTKVEKPGATARLAGEGGQGMMEKSRKVPMTDREAKAMIAHIYREQGTIESPDDVKEAMAALAELMERRKKLSAAATHDQPYIQALSGFRKLARALQRAFPYASHEQILELSANRIYENFKNLESLKDFTRLTMEESGAKAGETPATPAAPQEGGLTVYERTHPTEPYHEWHEPLPPGAKPEPGEVQPRGVPEEPGVRAQTPQEKFRDQARKISDDLFKLNNQYLADVEDAIPKSREVGKYYETLPAEAAAAVYQKLEEETVLGKSDIQLTGNEQKLYDADAHIQAENNEMYKELKDLEIPVSEQTIFPRMAKDVNSIFQRVARGVKRSITEGTILSRSASFTKHRILKAIVDNQGNRYTAAIVAGDKGGKLVVYDKGKGFDMGPFAWSDIVRRHQLMSEELAPIDHQMDELIKERRILSKEEGRKESAKRRLANIEKKLAELFQERQNVVDYYPEDELDHKVWVDKNGRQWRITDATTHEIESNMDVRFYKEPFSVLMAQNLKLRQMIRAARWLENFKKTPQFEQIARKSDERNIPPGWKRTELPQLRNYVFEPRVADVLNQFHERSKGQTPNILTSTNRLLMNAVFFANPFLHSPNLAAWWFTSRGAMAWANPGAYARMIRTGYKAFHDVANKTDDYVNYLRAGTPLQNTRANEFTRSITKMLHNEIDNNPTLRTRMANFLGYATGIKLSRAIGHAATSGLHDVLTLQLIYELQARHPEMKPHEAIAKIAAVMPDYRIPARVLGSRWISKMISNPNAVWFGAYHYSEGKAFSNMAKGLVGKGDLTRGEALDKIAATMFLMAVAYPIMDQLLKKVTGRKDLAFRRAGPTTMLTAARDVLTGKRTIEQVTPSFVSPALATVAALSLFFNKNLMFGGRGLPVYNPRQGLGQSLKNIAGFAGQTLNPVQIYRDISMGRYDWDQIFENLAGIRKDYSSESGAQLYGWAYDWAKRTGNQKLMHNFEQRGQEIFPPSDYTAIKNALADGNMTKARSELIKLQRIGKSDEEIDRQLRPGTYPFSGTEETEPAFMASLTASQRKVYEQAMGRRDRIYRAYLQISR